MFRYNMQIYIGFVITSYKGFTFPFGKYLYESHKPGVQCYKLAEYAARRYNQFCFSI